MPNPNLQLPIQNLRLSNGQSKLPTVLPLPDAARKYNLTEQALTQLIEAGKIGAVQLPSGELLVTAESNGQEQRTKEEIIAEKFAHLRGQPISASEASRKYSKIHTIPISNQLFSRWGQIGYITVLKRGYRLELDEADVAYCAEVYALKFREYAGQMSGVRIFDEDGNPYQVKYPEVAEQMRAERRLARKQVIKKE